MRLSAADRERLSRAIKDGEARSSAELVLVVADSCGGYGVFILLWPALAALLLGGVLALTVPHLTAPRLFLAEAVVFVIFAAGLQWPRALLWLVPPRVRQAHAQQIAEHQFAVRVDDRTPMRTGVLLFVALAERQVFVLPDSGITAVIPVTSWNRIIDRLVSEIRVRPTADAIGSAVSEILGLLEQHFPAMSGPQNALPNEVIELPTGSGNGGSLVERPRRS